MATLPLTDNANLGAGVKRSMEGNYPRPTVDNYSTSTGHRIVHGHNKPTGVKAWHLFLDPLDKTKAGALEVEFPDDSTVINLFVEKHSLQFPEPSYSCKVNFRIKWRKIRNVNRPGSTNVASEMELLPEDAPVSDTPAELKQAGNELTEFFKRDENNQPVDPAWGDDDAKRKAFFGKFNRICDDHAVPSKEREPIRKRVLKEKFGTDSLKGFNKPEDLLLEVLAEEIEPLYPLAMAQSQEAAKNGTSVEISKTGSTTPVSATNATAGKSVPQTGQSTAPATNERPTLKLVEQVANIRTMTGLSVADIHSKLDTPYPSAAYKAIKLAGGKQGTDIGSDFVRNRFEEVFGGHGIGWKFEAMTGLGDVRWEQLDVDGGLKYQVTIIMHVFKYRVVMPDGSLEWIELSPMSDVGTNVKASYAHRSAFTALLKQVLRSLGGMDHLKKAA